MIEELNLGRVMGNSTRFYQGSFGQIGYEHEIDISLISPQRFLGVGDFLVSGNGMLATINELSETKAKAVVVACIKGEKGDQGPLRPEQKLVSKLYERTSAKTISFNTADFTSRYKNDVELLFLRVNTSFFTADVYIAQLYHLHQTQENVYLISSSSYGGLTMKITHCIISNCSVDFTAQFEYTPSRSGMNLLGNYRLEWVGRPLVQIEGETGY